MWGNSHVRFGEREAGIRTAQAVDGVRVSTLRDTTPSKEDVSLTRQLVEGARLLGIRLHDHLIVGNGTNTVDLPGAAGAAVAVLLVLDPVPALARDLRTLPHALAQPLFVEAIRPLRGLTHTADGAWEAYREGRCFPSEVRAIERALIAALRRGGRVRAPGESGTGPHGAAGAVDRRPHGRGRRRGGRGAPGLLADPRAEPEAGPAARHLRRRALGPALPRAAEPAPRARPVRARSRSAVRSSRSTSMSTPCSPTGTCGGPGPSSSPRSSTTSPGPGRPPRIPTGADTTAAIRAALDAGDREAARTLAEARLQALVGLHARLAPSYLGAVA